MKNRSDDVSVAPPLEEAPVTEEIFVDKSRLWATYFAMDDAVLIADREGRRIDINTAFSRFHKYADVTDCAKTLAEFGSVVEVHTVDGALVPFDRWPVFRALAGETKTGLELLLHRKDTGEAWSGSYNYAPVRDSHGAIIGAIVTTKDTSAQRRVLEELRVSEKRLRQLYEIVPLGIVRNRVEDGKYTDFNDAFLAMTGHDREVLKERDLWKQTVTEDHEVTRAQLATLVQTGRYGPYEKDHVRADGSRISLRLHGALVTESDGVQYAWSIVEDITERRRHTEALAYYAAIVQSSTDAIIAKNLEGVITTWNPAAQRIFGYTPQEAVGQHISLLIPPDRLGEDDFILDRIRRGERLEQFTTVRWRKGGQEFPAALTVSPIRSATGEIIGASKILRDMTEQNLMQAQLRQAQKMEAIGNLTGGLAHDFNNLLGIVIGNLELMRSVDDPELARDALMAAERGADLTRGLLAFARRQPLQPEMVQLDRLIEETVRLLRRALGAHIDIVTRLEPDVGIVQVDPTLLSTALTNLATNARDAMPSGGTLTITTTQQRIGADDRLINVDIPAGDYAVISVTDTGTGIPAEILDHVFEPFFTTKDRDQGTGLGLSMVFGFVKQSGGHVNVYSEVGVGTRFSLYLPSTPGLALVRPVEREQGEWRGRGETVLVVEDNRVLRRTLARQLAALGYRVREASNAADALCQLEAAPVDLVFSDVIMPGGVDGFALAAQVAARWPEIAIVLTSGFPDDHLGQCLPTAEIPLLGKPYRQRELAHALRNALETVSIRARDFWRTS